MESVRRTLPVLAVVVALLATACSSDTGDDAASSDRPNVVFVLTDDLSMNLLEYMPEVRKLGEDGASFSEYSVTDSLCCPSRASILTGQFPHNTGVFTNSGNDGGLNAFNDNGNEDDVFATALQKAGYRTGFMGKYLNLYEPSLKPGDDPAAKRKAKKKGKAEPEPEGGDDYYVPPGWDEWHVAGNGYKEYDYTLNSNHKLVKYGNKPEDYMNTVLTDKAQEFITSTDGQPFFLEIASFTPHGPFTAAPQDVDKFPGLKAPRDPSFDKIPADAPSWLADREPLSEKEKQRIDKVFRKRAQAVQSVDRMIGELRATLSAAGIADDTVVVFSSDNGFHLGEHRLAAGKQTAFDTDVRVPLVMAGPGIEAGTTVDEQVQNVDLAPTFLALGGAEPGEADGRSVTELLDGTPPEDWRTTGLVEHHGGKMRKDDPDRAPKDSGNPPTYAALRTAQFTYVEYTGTDQIEYYDRTKDPHQLENLAGSLSADRKEELRAAVKAMTACEGAEECTEASRLLE